VAGELKYPPWNDFKRNSKQKHSATEKKPVPAGNLEQTSIFWLDINRRKK
jgi:hypothetical protein